MIENSIDFTLLARPNGELPIKSRVLITRFSSCYGPSSHGYDFKINYIGALDFIEMFAGSAHMSMAHSKLGMSIGFPMDIRMGYDLCDRRGQLMAWERIRL